MKNQGHFWESNLQSAPKPNQILRRFDWDYKTMTPTWNDQGKHCVETGDPHISFRKCFKVPDTHRIISEDYSSQELIVIGELSQEPVYIKAFEHGEDLHMAVAQAIFGCSDMKKGR